MAWKQVTKEKNPVARYTKPIVSLSWYNIKGRKYHVAQFSFSVQALKELDYKREMWCDIYRDDTKVLFEFVSGQGKHSRKVNRGKRNIQVRLYKASLDPVSFGDNKTFLLHTEGPKKGWIDLSEPVKAEKYLK